MPKPDTEKTESEPNPSGLASVFQTKSFLFFVFSVALLWAVAAAVIIKQNSKAVCTETYRQDIKISVNSQTIDAQVAQTPAEQSKGLSGRSCIGKDQGMLFTFGTPGHYPFWMKDMRFNIDIVWISPDHQVVHIEPNAAPSTYPDSFVNEAPAQDVLELASGRAASLGLQTGTQLSY